MVQENASVAITHEPARSGESDGRTGSGASAGCDGTGCGEGESAALLARAGAHATTASSTPANIPARPLADPADLSVRRRILVPHPPSCVTTWPGRKKGRLHVVGLDP